MRTVKFENAPFVEENPNKSPFLIPDDLMLWSPTNGKLVSIYHSEATPPTVALTSPTHGAMLEADVVMTLAATANDAEGAISKVEFYANDRLIAEDQAFPYTVDYTATDIGSYSFYAEATNTQGYSAVSAETVVSIGLNDFVDACESLEGWDSDGVLSLSEERLQGDQSIAFRGNENVEFSKAFTDSFSNGANPAFARLEFRYYVSDVALMGSQNQVELGSGGRADKDEYSWSIGTLSQGWNFISLEISEAKISGSPDLNAINWFRIYNFKSGEVTTQLDGIQIVDPSAGFSVREFSDLDQGSLFHFSLMSDNKGDSPYKASSSKREVSMQRLDAWVRSSAFVIGAGDHLVSAAGDDPFLDFINKDAFWRVKFYPNIADGENQAFGKGQGDWGAGWELFNYVDNFWDRPNVQVQPNNVDYYAQFEHSGFNVHLIQLHFADEPTHGQQSFKEESRQFLQDKLEELAPNKTNKDIVVVVAHSHSGDFVKDADFSTYRKDLLLSTADICVSATIHTFERYTDYNRDYPNGAVHYNAGAACHTGSTHGYMEFHVLDNPPRVVIQYINLEDHSARSLQTGYIDGIGDPTLAIVKELGGPAYNAEWSRLPLTIDECPEDPEKLIPGNCGCNVPEGSCMPLSLKVINGSGDGDFIKGVKVEIVADEAPAGYEFDFWGTLAGFPAFENVNGATTVLTMGNKPAQIMANYKPLVNDALFISQVLADTLFAGRTHDVEIRMLNTGGLKWDDSYQLFCTMQTRVMCGV